MTETRRLSYPSDWSKRKQENKKITVLTAYDAWMSSLLAETKIDALLVGDSLGMVVQGHPSTLDVNLENMIYHSQMVRRGAPDHFLIADMPFGSYQVSSQQAIQNGIHLVQRGKADAVKVESTHPDLLAAIQKLVSSGVPVMGHIGLTPQSYRNTDGFRVQGRTPASAQKIKQEALSLQEAGCFAVVLELLVTSVAKEITESLDIPTIGIGAGPHTSGQVLVFHDLLGLNLHFHPKHTRLYVNLGKKIVEAVDQFHDDVQKGDFLDRENSLD